MENLPAGAEYDKRAPYNEKDYVSDCCGSEIQIIEMELHCSECNELCEEIDIEVYEQDKYESYKEDIT